MIQLMNEKGFTSYSSYMNGNQNEGRGEIYLFLKLFEVVQEEQAKTKDIFEKLNIGIETLEKNRNKKC